MTDRVVFTWIVVAGVLGSLAGVPWSIAVLNGSGTVWLSAAVEVVLFLTPASAVGVWLGKKASLGPRLRDTVPAVSEGRGPLRSVFVPAILVGLALGGAGFLAQNSIPKSALMPGLSNPNTFEWLLRCVSAALTEEIFFRLGLMTLLVWAIRSLIKWPSINVPSLWVGNLLSALVFAGAHLPQITSHDWGLLVPVVMFSCGAGMLMGWLYVRYGLISAIVAHFLSDLVVYVVPRLTTVTVWPW